MQITHSHKHISRPFILGVVVIIVLLGGYAAFAKFNSLWPFVQMTDSTTGDSMTSHTTSTAKNSSGSSIQSPADKTPQQYDTSASSDSSSDRLTGSINYKSVIGSTLSIRATIDQSVTSGTCNLTLINQGSGKTVTKSATIITNPSSSTCNGFDIPTSELGSGNWNITIDLSSNDKNGKITDTVSIS